LRRTRTVQRIWLAISASVSRRTKSCGVNILAGLALVAFSAQAAPANAGVLSVVISGAQGFQQTGPTTVVPSNGGTNATFTADAVALPIGLFNGGSLAFPGSGSPQALTSSGNVSFFYQSPQETPAALISDYPSGQYSLTLTNSGTSASQTFNINYINDLSFGGAVPAATPATFARLTHLNFAKPLVFGYNGFSPDVLASFSEVELAVFDLHGGSPPQFFTAPSTAAGHIVAPTGTFRFGAQYELLLDYVQGFVGQDPNGVNISSVDVLVTPFLVSPTFAVPEPGAWAMMLIGLGAVGAAVRRARPIETKRIRLVRAG
jgi:hypothetical protein